MAKMNKKWITLCSIAIGAIYTADYYATEAQANATPAPAVQQTQQVQSTRQDLSANPSYEKRRRNRDDRDSFDNQQTQQTQRTQQTQKTQPAAASGTYKDGTFTGTGSNRRGSIQVTVTIKKNKITDVEISRFAMHYSERDVVGLPDEVLHNQSAQVDNVSGATYSVRAFEDAVQNALSQAQSA